jgi:hypothetical protein
MFQDVVDLDFRDLPDALVSACIVGVAAVPLVAWATAFVCRHRNPLIASTFREMLISTIMDTCQRVAIVLQIPLRPITYSS